VQERPEGSNTSLYQVFERINTSGRTLFPQEIRNCVYQGPLNSLLVDLNRHPNWRTLYGQATEDPRMRDMEYILRFFALSSAEFQALTSERISLKRFLNTYMKGNARIDEAASRDMAARFRDSVDLVHDTFGPTAYHNVSPSQPTKLVNKFSPTIFDSLTIAADYAKRHGGTTLPADPGETRRLLLQQENYRLAISQETMRRANIRLRVTEACRVLFGLTYE
jgi:hypothetical protein